MIISQITLSNNETNLEIYYPILLEYSCDHKCIPDYWKATQFDATIAFHLFKISILVSYFTGTRKRKECNKGRTFDV